METKCTALIIDLVGSRGYTSKHRNEIQQFMLQTVNLLNNFFQRSLLQSVDFSAGDELQGLFDTPQAAYLYLRWFSMLLNPVQIRAGIGVGTWDVRLDGKGTTGQDGTAYHNARRAIQSTNTADDYSVLLYSGSESDPTINTIIGSAAAIASKQSISQNQIMLVSELVFPICCDGAPLLWLWMEHPYEIINLFARKLGIDRTSMQREKELPLDRIIFYIDYTISTQPTEVQKAWDSFVVRSGKQRGIPTAVAGFLGVTRQTVERSLKSGNVYLIRNMVITALHEMEKIR